MWRPSEWSEIQALIGFAEESSSLDFKREVSSKGGDIAKDIAAMAIDGGVLLYGVEEDKASGVAAATPKVQISGVEERLRQIASGSIRPAPAFEVRAITESPGDKVGVIAVVVPPSSLAPHEVDGRFPRRDGTTTSYLTEPEIDRLYRSRRNASSPSVSFPDLTEAAGKLPNVDETGARSVYRHVGQVTVASKLVGTDRHPSDPWLLDPLMDAVACSGRFFSSLSTGRPRLFTEIEDRPWTPFGTEGWRAGRIASPEIQQRSESAAAVLLYPSNLLTRSTVPLRAGSEGELEYDCTFEWWVVREVLAGLQFAGRWADQFEASGLVQLGVSVAGFNDSIPFWISRATSGIELDTEVRAPHGVTDTCVTTALTLKETPEEIGRRMIDRWLAAFYRGDDLFDKTLT